MVANTRQRIPHRIGAPLSVGRAPHRPHHPGKQPFPSAGHCRRTPLPQRTNTPTNDTAPVGKAPTPRQRPTTAEYPLKRPSRHRHFQRKKQPIRATEFHSRVGKSPSRHQTLHSSTGTISHTDSLMGILFDLYKKTVGKFTLPTVKG